MPVKTRKRKSKTATPEPSTSGGTLGNGRWSIWLLAFVILFFAFVRFRLREMPLERDEGEYAYSGQLMLQGIPPYQLAYNMKLPGTYAAYAIMMAIFGQTCTGIHIGLLLANAATTVLVFFLARKLFERRPLGDLSGSIAASFAGITYAVLSTSPSVLGLAGHATHFVVFAAVGGVLFLLHALDNDRPAFFFASGLCLGLAFLMKQPGIVFSAFAVSYLIHRKWKHPFDWRSLVLRTSVLSAGILIPLALTGLLLFWSGVFRNFWFWTFSYARTYASTTPFAIGMQELQHALTDIFRLCGAVWAIAACGVVALLWNRRDHAVFIFGLALFSLAGVSVGLYFRSHYFILLLPAVALLAGLAVGTAQQALRDRSFPRAVQAIPALVFVAACVFSLVRQSPFLFAADATTACQRTYYNSPFVEAQQISEYLKTNSTAGNRLAVFGSEPEIYFYSHLHSATGYIYTYSLMEDQPYAPRMQQEMIDEVTRAHPEFVIFVDDEISWLWQSGESRQAYFTWLQTYINSNYVKAAQVDIAGSPGHLLDDDARIYVYRRKAP